jgi:hypothetical protein
MRQQRNWRMHQVNEHRQRIDERKLYNLCINNLLDIVKLYMCTRGHIFCDEGDRTTFRVAQVLYPERYKMSDLLKALNGHPQHSEPVGSWIGMIVATSVLVAATLRLGW